jgi:uncharacterized protein
LQAKPGYTIRVATIPNAEKLEELRQSWRPTPEKVDLAVKAAIGVANPSRVFIFGSWARGEATAESDLDLAVLFSDDRKAELGKLRQEISRAIKDIRMSVDLVVATEGYTAEFASSVNSVYYKILHRGKLAYDSRNR